MPSPGDHKKAVVPSWEVWKEKRIFHIAYDITTLILVAGAGLMIWFVANRGFEKVEIQVWLFFTGSYSTMISYWLVMRRKMK